MHKNLLLALQGWDPSPWAARLATHLPHHPIRRADQPFIPESIVYAATWKHPPGLLATLPNLKLIFSLGAGVDHLMRDPKLPSVPILRVADPDLTFRMGEWVLLHTLMVHRQHARYAAQQAARVWDEDENQPAARDVRVGIMGLGVLGQHAAHLLRMTGFNVAGWSRAPKTVDGIRCYAGHAELKAFLNRTDILVVLLPLTPETQGVLNRALFAELARDGRLGGPSILNAGRGGLQREADILAALDDGTLKTAILDVFETEPLPLESPLWRHPRVIITPHNAAMSEPDAIAALIARQISRFEAGEALENVVDRRTGY
jgi:glyoxylate/hydroxypyruvate reductase